VETLDEGMRIAAPGTESGAFFMMVLSYWEQACALLNYGLLHEGLFFETSGEFFGVWERVKPIVPQARERFVNKQFLAHMEKAAQRYEAWIETRSPGHIAAMRQFMNRCALSLQPQQKPDLGSRVKSEPATPGTPSVLLRRRLALFVALFPRGCPGTACKGSPPFAVCRLGPIACA